MPCAGEVCEAKIDELHLLFIGEAENSFGHILFSFLNDLFMRSQVTER
jgi:hypothetical protein